MCISYNNHSIAEKENISALAQLATGLAVASVGGDVGDVSTGIAAGKNAVENNLLSNERGVEKLNKENKKLYERIKDVVGYDEIDQLQKQYMNCQSDECKTAVYNDYYQKEREAGQKLVDLYKSGQLTKADFEQLVTWYNDSMLEGVEEAKKDAGRNRNLWDIYDASSMDMTPAGLIGNPHLAEIRGLILLEEWRAEGLSESQIQEKFIKDDVLGAFGSGPDVNAIVHQIRNEGLSLEDGLKLATLGAYSKITNDASKGKKQQIAGNGTKLEIDPNKFDYLYGKVNSGSHNTARSTQLSQMMRRLGLQTNESGTAVLTEHFNKVINTKGNVIDTYKKGSQSFEVRESFLMGPSGKGTILHTSFEIMPDGSRRFVTTIPKEGKK